jgi:hypothetical protein
VREASDASHLPAVGLRASALTFTEGVGAGWLASDLAAWAREHLVRAGRLELQAGGDVLEVHEPGVGAVALAPEAVRNGARERRIATSEAPRLLSAARSRVVASLRGVVATGDAAFVHAALYAGRVLRSTGADGRGEWRVRLAEGAALSDQVLALFAADKLTHPEDYETDLTVCDACGAVAFLPAALSRRGCVSHPYGASDAFGRASVSPPSRRPARS